MVQTSEHSAHGLGPFLLQQYGNVAVMWRQCGWLKTHNVVFIYSIDARVAINVSYCWVNCGLNEVTGVK